MTTKYFEDFCVGPLNTESTRAVTRESVKAFAESFDRLPLHLDEAYAAKSMFGGIIASGLQTLSLAASIIVDDVLADSSMTGGLGMTSVRWLKPVRPGDTLRVKAEVVELENFSQTPPIGRMRISLKVVNQIDHVVLTALVDYLLLHRTQTGHDPNENEDFK